MQTQQTARVPLCKVRTANQFHILRRKPQQTQLIRHRRLCFPYFTRGFLLRQSVLIDQTLETVGFLEKIQITPLQAFVSEIFGDEADELRKRGGDGGEFGATTGRPRRMGWFDCVATKYGCRIQGTTDVAFTVVDVLGYLDKIPVCVGYEIDGEVTTDFPTTRKLEKAKPVIEVLDGWKSDIRGIKKYEDLPENCKKYIDFVEKHIGFPITMVSNGPKREDIIYRESPLSK